MKKLDKLCLSTKWGVKGAEPPRRPAACEDTQPNVAKTHVPRAPKARAALFPLFRGQGGKRARENRRRQGSEVFARARIYLDYIDAFSDTVRWARRCA